MSSSRRSFSWICLRKRRLRSLRSSLGGVRRIITFWIGCMVSRNIGDTRWMFYIAFFFCIVIHLYYYGAYICQVVYVVLSALRILPSNSLMTSLDVFRLVMKYATSPSVRKCTPKELSFGDDMIDFRRSCARRETYPAKKWISQWCRSPIKRTYLRWHRES